MTECERIISEGILPTSFLEPEIRSGFCVTTERKKLWAICLDLLLQFKEICDKNELKWCLSFGSLLGAIRHQGFIPWDDDVDIFMPRKDFDKLLYLNTELPAPYFLQTPYSDPTYFYTTIRLRNSNTSFIDEPFRYQGFNQGIHVGMAPLDFVPENPEKEFAHLHDLIIKNSVYMRLTNPFLSERDKKRVAEYKKEGVFAPIKIYEEIQNLARNAPSNDMLWSGVSQPYSLKQSIFFAKDFDKIVYSNFEGLKMPIPAGYHRILTTIYGDYMQLPPIETRGLHHSSVKFYPDIPYREIVSKQNSYNEKSIYESQH